MTRRSDAAIAVIPAKAGIYAEAVTAFAGSIEEKNLHLEDLYGLISSRPMDSRIRGNDNNRGRRICR